MRLISVLFLSLLFACSVHADDKWSWVGPETGKYVADVYGDPLHPQMYYAINDGRLFRSVNNAKSWIPTGEAGYSVIVHPVTGRIFLVQAKSYVSVTLLESKDQGKSFRLLSSLKNSYTPVVSPLDDQLLASSGNGFFGVMRRSVFRISADGGATWKDLSSSLPLQPGTGFSNCAVSDSVPRQPIFSPQNKNTIFMSIGYVLTCHQRAEALAITKDLGNTWTILIPSFPGISFQSDPNFADRVFGFTREGTFEIDSDSLIRLTRKRFTHFVTDPNDRNHLIGYFRSSLTESFDGGRNWQIAEVTDNFRFTPTLIMQTPPGALISATGQGGIYKKLPNQLWKPANQGFGNSSLVTSIAAQGNAVYCSIAQKYLYRSNDQGKRWIDISEGAPQGEINEIAVNPQNGNEILLQVGVPNRYGKKQYYRSVDAGKQWQLLFQHRTPFSKEAGITFDQNHPSTIFFADGNGVYRSAESGFNPVKIFSRAASRIILDPAKPEFAMIVGVASKLWKSMNGGRTFFEADGGIEPEDNDENAIEDVGVPSSSAPYFDITGRGAIFRSTNGGTFWKRIAHFSNYYGDSHGEPHGGQRIFPADNSGSHLYITNDLWIMESTDGGIHWSNRSKLFFDHFTYNRFFFEMTDPKRKPFYLATSNGVFRHD